MQVHVNNGSGSSVREAHEVCAILSRSESEARTTTPLSHIPSSLRGSAALVPVVKKASHPIHAEKIFGFTYYFEWIDAGNTVPSVSDPLSLTRSSSHRS